MPINGGKKHKLISVYENSRSHNLAQAGVNGYRMPDAAQIEKAEKKSVKDAAPAENDLVLVDQNADTLKKIADDLGVKYAKNASKKTLIELIEAAQKAAQGESEVEETNAPESEEKES